MDEFVFGALVTGVLTGLQDYETGHLFQLLILKHQCKCKSNFIFHTVHYALNPQYLQKYQNKL